MSDAAKDALISDEIKQNFLEKVEKIPEDKGVLLVLHDGPDPDAFGAAFACQNYFMSLRGIESDIVAAAGSETNLQNQAIKKVLGIEVKDKKFFEKNKKKYGLVVFCDTNSTHTSFSIEPDIIIDHHTQSNTLANTLAKKCLLIHAPVGASCTLVYQLLKNLGAEIAQDVLVALAAGIYIDTNGFTNDDTTEIDNESYVGILSHINWQHYQSLDRLCHRPPISHPEINLRGLAYTTKICEGGLAYVFLGITASEHQNLYGSIADDFLRLPDIEVAVVLAVENGKRLKGSIRIASQTVQVNELIESVFRAHYFSEESGASYGARTSAGGFDIPLLPVQRAMLKAESEDEGSLKEDYLEKIKEVYFEALKKFLAGRREE